MESGRMSDDGHDTELARDDYARVFMEALPVAGTAVSTIGDLLGTETVSASDTVAARLDELQFDLGEGPCWDALRSRRPVFEPDLRERPTSLWPTFSPAALDVGVAALFAFPMLIGPLQIGAVDMYAREPLMLDEADTRHAGRLAELAARRILHDALSTMSDELRSQDDNPFSRRVVHQATGMVLAQLDVDADDALMIIQAHAYATDRSMMEVSREVLEGRLDFGSSNAGGSGPR
ncbi:GAF and ANTAR domain-containing protein [Leifsonia shinshuensis]|uniref:GAF and ANTAR domain-containing protein n=1 Tax=Leifsonia shinshuensis TaxID=150026 RepID=UPI00285C901C|nr:GAF and ANTAR domain-containing protein [Leifsonia shinshuensis]MDR6970542.1 GAF domain-containing protein [Leifsonia shinshuensis]